MCRVGPGCVQERQGAPCLLDQTDRVWEPGLSPTPAATALGLWAGQWTVTLRSRGPGDRELRAGAPLPVPALHLPSVHQLMFCGCAPSGHAEQEDMSLEKGGHPSLCSCHLPSVRGEGSPTSTSWGQPAVGSSQWGRPKGRHHSGGFCSEGAQGEISTVGVHAVGCPQTPQYRVSVLPAVWSCRLRSG